MLTPAETSPAGSPKAVIAVTVLKYLVPVAVQALAPVIDSVSALPFSSVPVTVK